ncbi:hypothetical protein TrVE_jg4225 [Triparma verrucosa]|uniref:UBP-type domain-containing protein n=2 Tax=Triparma TaxID=722752 RepID=A0A9W7AF83_9STRA|nr:hypothetical protein TrVE_jg4225 [Triparma verrucosa]GMH71202.1 hypothetical protein TrST_g10478 [Triparma strigata]
MQGREGGECGECGGRKSLWVCLTCGFLGCGRYESAHSLSHYKKTGHPWSFELGGGRVWDYGRDGFRHKIRLGRCEGKVEEGRRVGKKNEEVREEFQGMLESVLEGQRVWGEQEVERVERGLVKELRGRDWSGEEEEERRRLKESIERMEVEEKEMSSKVSKLRSTSILVREKSQKLLLEQKSYSSSIKSLRETASKEKEDLKVRVGELELQVEELTNFIGMQRKIESSGAGGGDVLGTIGGEEDKKVKRKGKKKK